MMEEIIARIVELQEMVGHMAHEYARLLAESETVRKEIEALADRANRATAGLENINIRLEELHEKLSEQNAADFWKPEGWEPE